MTFCVNDFLNKPHIKGNDDTDYQSSEENKNDRIYNSVLIFEYGNSLLALHANKISSIITNPGISQIPFISKRNSLGFISYSGCAVPVLNLAAILGINTDQRIDKIVIFSCQDLQTAFAPERILGVEKIYILEKSATESNSLLEGKAYFNSRPISIINIEQLIKVVSERLV